MIPNNNAKFAWWLVGLLVVFAVVDSLKYWRIGPHLHPKANETAAASTCAQYVKSQKMYQRYDWDNDLVLEFAQTNSELEIVTKTASHSLGNYFVHSDLDQPNPIPKAGYFFKILKCQGAAVKDGKKSFLDAGGNMTGGFALVGCPATYDTTGCNTFLVSHTGTIYSKDLGPDTLSIVKQMTEFNPDTTWTPSE